MNWDGLFRGSYSIRRAKAELIALIEDRFIQRARPVAFEPKLTKFSAGAPFAADKRAIRKLFALMFQIIDGANGVTEGTRFNFITTNYDNLIEAVFDSTLAEGDSFGRYLYRGVTPVRFVGDEDPEFAYSHDWLVFNLLKLNGGFEVLRSDHGYVFDYRQRSREL